MKLSSVFKHLFKLIGFAILVAIFAMVAIIYWDVFRGDNSEYTDIKQAILQYGDDLNDMREYLYLPRNNYDFFSTEDLEIDRMAEPEEREQPHITGISTFAKQLAAEKNLAKGQEAARQKLRALMDNERFLVGIGTLDLTVSQDIESSNEYVSTIVSTGTENLARILVDIKTDRFAVLSIVGKDPIEVMEGETLAQKVLSYLTDNKDRIIKLKNTLFLQQDAIKQLLTDSEINTILGENSLTVNLDPVETEAGFETYITDTNGAPLLTILLGRSTGRFTMNENEYASTDELRSPLIETLKPLDGQSEYVRDIQQKKTDLETYLNGEEIKTIFGNTSIDSKEGRTEEGRTYYDLTFTENDTEDLLGTIIFDEATGGVSFLKAGETEEISLEALLGSKKKS